MSETTRSRRDPGVSPPMEQQPQLEFRGNKTERAIAEQVFGLMMLQGAMHALDAPIRQSLRNLTEYFVARKLRKDPEEVARLIAAALSKNDHVFAQEEREGEVLYTTTRRGHPVRERPARALPPRQLHPAPQGATPTPRRRAVHRPPMSPFWVRAAIRQLQPLRPEVPPPAVFEPALPTVEEVAVAAVGPKPGPVTQLTLEDGSVIDFRQEVEAIFAEKSEAVGRALKAALERDFRVISFGDAWYLEEQLEHFSKGRLNEIRRYILEEETPLSDQTILADLLFKNPRDPDYELWAFSLNARLLREKKDFEYVGVPGANLWSVKGLPTIGSRLLKATEIGQDYAFLLEEPTAGQVDQWEHFLTFYEYQHGVLPYDGVARAFFPQPLLEEQRSAYLRLEIPQHYEAYAVELRFPSGNRGGWLWGLEDFFHNSLVPGALIILSRTEEPNVFILHYMATEEQERRLLVLDERKNRYAFDDITFYCEVEESLLLSEERFRSLRNTSPLPPAVRRRPADVLAHTFTRIGKKQDGSYVAAVEDLFAVANIERPFSMAFLRRILEETEVFFPAEEEGFYRYTPGEEGE